MFYLVAYALMTLGAFGVVMLVVRPRRGADARSTRTPASRSGARCSPALMTVVPALARGHPAHGRVRREGDGVQRGDRARATGRSRWSASWRAWWRRSSTSASIVLMYMQEPQGSFEEDAAADRRRSRLAIPAIVTLVLGVFPA